MPPKSCTINLYMINDYTQYKKLILNYLKTLEDLTHSTKYKDKDAKFLSQLRSAERSFNFLLDQFPPGQVAAMFGKEKWDDIKHRRIRVASKVSHAIDTNPEVKARYVAYCEFLKDTRRLSNSL